MRTNPRPNGHTSNSPIARRRIALGMTQKQLAEAVGCYPKDICRWERCKCEPRINALLKLADALNCTVDELIQTDPNEQGGQVNEG